MPGNSAAREFWRRAIARISGGNFAEVEVTQGWWHGTVQALIRNAVLLRHGLEVPDGLLIKSNGHGLLQL